MFSLPIFRQSTQMCYLMSRRYAGHSKWANIKHIKAVKDAQRGLLFTRLSRQMKVAIQEGGSANPDTNLRLAQVIDQAKRANMPVATIQNVIKSTQQKKDDCKPALLEIKGPSGVIILCEIFTDNLAKCKMNISTIMKKFNASFSDGGGRHLFNRKGIVETSIKPKPNQSVEKTEEILEKATEHAILSGSEDVKLLSDNILQFICDAYSVHSVEKSLKTFDYDIISSNVEYIPINCVQINDSDLNKLEVLLEKLENCEDVVNVYDNIALE